MRNLLSIRTWIGFLVMVFVSTSAVAVGRNSASYRVLIDAVTTGGGALASANFRMADSAAGQSLPAGCSASTQYRNEAGVVVGQGDLAVRSWVEY